MNQGGGYGSAAGKVLVKFRGLRHNGQISIIKNSKHGVELNQPGRATGYGCLVNPAFEFGQKWVDYL